MASKRKTRAKKRSKIEIKKNEQIKTQHEMNPFELHHNKIKHNILGRKIAKNEFGKPLISRSRAYKKREQTLLQEYKNLHKSGHGLRDLREKDAEKRMIEKYRLEQNQINLDQNNVFELTHKGKPLEEVIDDRISDEDDIDLLGRDDYVETSHFGGGEYGQPKSKDEIINRILEEKAQIKQEREETLILTEQLDNQWNEIRDLIRHKGSNEVTTHDSIHKSNSQDYDNLLKQLVFNDKNIAKEFENLPKSISKLENDEKTWSQTPDGLFKHRLNVIENSDEITKIIGSIKSIIDLSPKVTDKSLIILKERIIDLTEKKLKFTPKEMAILIIGAYFKEFQVLIHLIILKTLKKIKYKDYNEVAFSLFLNKFLIKTISNDKFYPELFVHIENLICLCLPRDKTKIKLFHRLDQEVKCILNISKLSNDQKKKSKYLVNLTNLFQNKFKNDPSSLVLTFNLTFQVFELLSSLFEKYDKSPALHFMLSPLMQKIDLLFQGNIPDQMEIFLNDLREKFKGKSSNSIIINDVQSKPFMLPLLEPKFDEDFRIRPKTCERKKLVKKYKREFKGAQREIRKDSKFLRDTYLKEIEKKDRKRQQKVKEILKDLSVQQGLYKKKK